jgi:hypothetical protein
MLLSQWAVDHADGEGERMSRSITSMAIGLCFAALSALGGCDAPPGDPRYYDEDIEVLEAGALRDEDIHSRTKADGGTNGDNDYCADPAFPCDEGEGDCDSDDDCAGTLVCGINNGAVFGFVASTDVCWPAHCEDGIQSGDETGIDYGGSCSLIDSCPPPGVQNSDPQSYCTVECPCITGFGDCDRDTHCQEGLVCGLNNGGRWGMPPRHDVCWPETCENKVLDGDETAVDYGGSCGTTEQCLLALWFPDGDGDGYGDGVPFTDCDGITPSGYVKNNEDCNDGDPDQNPDGIEICDGVDNDCNGALDDGAPGAVTWYEDGDGDGYGDVDSATTACFQPSGYVSDRTDCNDFNPAVNPGETEICGNAFDEDCDTVALACRAEGTVDASTDAFARLAGAVDDGLGYAIAHGDFDGDGEEDLVLGGPVIPWRTTPVNPGHTYLFYGPLSGGTGTASSTADAQFNGEADFDHAGTALGVGDLDLDGADDLTIGAPYAEAATAGGKAYVNYGGARFSGVLGLGSSDLVMTGENPYSWFGTSISSGRNAAGSAGYPELLIGASGDLNSGTSGLDGTAMMIKGQATQRTGVQSVGSVLSVRFFGTSTDGAFGTSATLVGNVAGGLAGDVAVSGPGMYWWPVAGDAYPGAVYIWKGAILGSKLDTSAPITISGDDNDDWVGVFVDGQDLDGDGVNELLVSASGDSAILTEAGKLAIFRGLIPDGGYSISDADITIRGDAAYQYVGESASVGDFDGDGNPDLALGVWDFGAYVWYGPVGDIDVSLGSADVIITSSAATEGNVGWPATFVGDVTGDGVDDLAVGDVGDSASAGAVYILAGASL